MATVFVSHAGADTATATQVGEWLRTEGHEVFLDRDGTDGITIGDDWSQRLLERLRWADAVICLLSSAYARSTWCTAEVAIATSHGSRLLPLTIEEGADHPMVRPLQHFALWSDPHRARDAVAAVLREIDGTGGRAWPDDRPPFPGLMPFTAREQRAFFGRERDVRRLLDGVRSAAQAATPVTLVVGPSGCGKSSLVMAGLVPAVRNDTAWRSLDAFTPAADPLSPLVRELVRAGRAVQQPWTAADVRARLLAGGLPDLATDLLSAGQGDRRRLLVVVDQFEELVTQADPTERRRFVGTVLARTAGGAVQVVGTLRPEFLDVLAADPAFAEVSPSIELVQPLPTSALPSVVERPARLAGIEIEDGLVARIVEDTGSGDALPLLAYTLAELAKGVGRRGCLTHARYDELGGVRGALVTQADAALADAVARHARTEQEVMRELLRLVTVDGQGRPSRLRLPTSSLSDDAENELGAFVERRILVTGEDVDRPTIGVAHEAVLTAWEPLATAIRDERVALRARDAVDEAAQLWAQDDRPAERLWERSRVAATRQDLGMRSWRPSRSDRVVLSERAAEFLRLSARRSRVQRTRSGLVAAALLVVALVGSVIAIVQSRAAIDQNTLALTRRLVAQAEAARGGDDRTALQLGIAAVRLRADATTAASLVETASGTPYARTLPVPSGVAAEAFTRDGRLLATGSVAGLVQLWDATDPHRPTPIGVPLDSRLGTVYSVEFSPDGRTLAVAGGASGGGRTVLWDVSDPAVPRPLPDIGGHTDVVHAATFSPDGRTLATVGFDGTVRLWDVTDQARTAPLGGPSTGHAGKVATAAFSPDGRTLATGGYDHQVLLWNVTDRTRPLLVGPAPDGPGNTVWALAWSGTSLAAASADGTVRMWDATDPAAAHRTGENLVAGSGQKFTLAFAPDGTRLAAGGTDRVVTVWDVTDRDSSPLSLGGHAEYVYAVAFRDAATLVSGGADGTAVVWDLGGGPAAAALATVPGPDAEVYAATTTPDGRVLVTGTADGRIGLTDVGTGGLVASIDAGPGAVRTLAVTPAGGVLAVGGDAGVALWDIADTARPRRLADVGDQAGLIYSVAVTGDGRTLATAGDDGVVRLWDIADPARPRPRAELTGHTGAVYTVGFGGTRLAAGGADNAVLLWDVGDVDRPMPIGEPLKGHAAPVDALALSSDGTTLATGGADGSVQLWSIDVAGLPRPFGRQPASRQVRVLSTALGPDGRTLVAGYEDGRVALWDLSEPGYPHPLGPDVGEPTAVHALAFLGRTPAVVTAARVSSVRRWDLSGLTALRSDPAAQACALVHDGLDPTRWATFLPGVPYETTCPTA